MTGAAPEGRVRRFQVRIALALSLVLCGLLVLAVATVTWLNAVSGRDATLELLRQKSDVVLQLLIARIESQLRPVETMVEATGRAMESGALPMDDPDAVGRHLASAMTAVPDARFAAFLRGDTGQAVVAERTGDGIVFYAAGLGAVPDPVRRAVRASAGRYGVFWGDVVRLAATSTPLMNARRAVYRGSAYVGLLTVAVRVDTLSEGLIAAGREAGGEVFVLYGDDRVLAHPSFVRTIPAERGHEPLPSVAELGDPVVGAFVLEERSRSTLEQRFTETTGIRLVRAGAERRAVLSRRFYNFADLPLTVAVHQPVATVLAELRRLMHAILAGAAILLVALVFAVLFARYLSRPVARLADAAADISELSLDRVQRLPPSVFRELAEASEAFNRMVVGLRWFETYVPKALVHRLMRQGEGGVVAFSACEATILFTDIVGFTAATEEMTAQGTAAFLNAHFARLAAEVELEGGTIDKFIGDALMAFWGAPVAEPDDAARACRAALAIREALRIDNERRRAAGEGPVGLRLGLHTGTVIVGNIGAPERINYTIVGDAVNIVNRLEDLGHEIDDGRQDAVILVSGETAAAARAYGISARPLGHRRVRGRRGEVTVYAL